MGLTAKTHAQVGAPPEQVGRTTASCDVYLFRGILPFKVAELHEKYGPVVRITLNELFYVREECLE